MNNNTESYQTRPDVPYPSKSQCLKMLRKVFGPRTRYMTLDEGQRLAVIEYVDGKHERPLVEVEAQEPEGRAILYWAAFVSACKVIGFQVERVAEGGKLARIDFLPIFREAKDDVKQLVDTTETTLKNMADSALAQEQTGMVGLVAPQVVSDPEP